MTLRLTALLLVSIVASSAVAAPTTAARPKPCRNDATAGYVAHYPTVSDEDEAALQQAGGVDRLGDVPRSYLLYVPAGIEKRTAPLLVTLHGLGGSGGQHAEKIEMEPVADRHGFIVASPTGERSWDNSDRALDIGFIRAVVADIRADFCIDARRIFASGHSNGGFMTHRLACDAADLFAAGASMAAGDVENGLQGGPCQPEGRAAPAGEEAMPIAMWHGTDDSVIRYSSGRLGLTKWLARYECNPEPLSVTDDIYGRVEVYGSCSRPDVVAREGFAVAFRTLDDHNHGWANACGGTPTCDPATPERPFPTANDLNEEMWMFLTAHRRDRPAA